MCVYHCIDINILNTFKKYLYHHLNTVLNIICTCVPPRPLTLIFPRTRPPDTHTVIHCLSQGLVFHLQAVVLLFDCNIH